MKRFDRRVLAVSAALLALAGGWGLSEAPIHAQASAAPAAVQRFSNAHALAKSYVADNKVPGIVIAIGVGDAPTEFIAEGNIAEGAGAAPATADSLWRVYSMTKPITGMAAMMLVEDGKISLDQPVSDFIPAFKDMKVLTDPDNSLATRPAARPITIRNLLTHTAGLGYSIITKGPLLAEYQRLGLEPGQFNEQTEGPARTRRPASLEEFANRVGTLPLIADPGSKWSYSIGLDVMGRVIEVASGMTFDEFLQKRIFTPLKMTSTGFTVPQSEVGRFATNYLWAGDNRVPIDPAATSVYLAPPSFPYGGAGLVSSARDYDRFLHMLANGGELDGVRVMKRETVRLAMSNLLPAGTDTSLLAALAGGPGAKLGFGAGGSVYLEDTPGGGAKGTYGWAGAAGTLAWVDPVRRVRGTVMVNYFPGDKWPLRADVVKAIVADGGR